MSAFYMCGMIWLIQLIHYPSFFHINASSFQQFHSQHTAVMGLIVGPAMVVELLTALWLLNYETNLFNLANATIILALWLLTFLVSVPLHNKLAQGHDLAIIQNLIQTNWPRTILWTVRAGLSGYLTVASLNT